MVRGEVSLLQRMRPHPRLRTRMTALVLVVVFGLIAAPAWSALRNECDLCPPTCPMHHAGNTSAPASPHLHCHGAQNSTSHHAAERAPTVPKVARPPCGNHGVTSATILPPVILATVPIQRVTLLDHSAPPIRTHSCTRLTEPPDTPPPIAAA